LGESFTEDETVFGVFEFGSDAHTLLSDFVDGHTDVSGETMKGIDEVATLLIFSLGVLVMDLRKPGSDKGEDDSLTSESLGGSDGHFSTGI
jgi:hypothetical protein